MKLPDLVRRAGQLGSMEEHKRAETEKDLFGEVRLGFLVEALDLDMATEDMVAFLRLLVSCGRRKKILSARAVEYLSKLLQSRRWQRVLHSDLELMNQLNSFVEEYPEAKKSLDLSELGPPVDSGAARPALPATLDEETARLIQQPLDAGLQGMAKCSWRFSGDADAEAFKQFKQGINRLSNTALAKEAKLAGAPVAVLQRLDEKWPNILQFLVSVHEAKKLWRSQVAACAQNLRELSAAFAAAEARAAEGVPWRPAEAAEKEVPEVAAPEAPEPEPPAPAPEEPPPAEPEEPKPGFLGRFFGKEASPKPAPAAFPEPPPAPPAAPAVAAATMILPPKAAPSAAAGSGYPAKAKPAPAPVAKGPPVIVWVDGNPKAWQSSKLKGHSGIDFQGFDGNNKDKPWLEYCRQKALRAEHVAVVIMNRRHKADAEAIWKSCVHSGVDPPRFIVMCKQCPPEDVCREWGMQDIQVVHDWVVAADNALSEARTPAPSSAGPSAPPLEM